jgi:alpha-tubulin suppressor-like RCC1 family protein
MAYACGRLTSGGVRCWQMIAPGKVPKNKVRMDPVGVIIDDAVSLAIGDAGGCAVTSKGVVKCWGQTALYTASATDSRAKTQPEWKDVVQIALASAFACARTIQGEVSCKWQDGARETIAGASGAVELTCGNDHACVRKSDGTVHCWGENAYGQLGDGTKTSRRTAAPVRW